MSVWVEISPRYANLSISDRHAPRERVSWNFTFRNCEITTADVTLHVSVWVEIALEYSDSRGQTVTLHVSVWVEMSVVLCLYLKLQSHAPRERVSWNWKILPRKQNPLVTLHVSVWVEIFDKLYKATPDESRSTWACELKSCGTSRSKQVVQSRSTWACELKWLTSARCFHQKTVTLHVSVWVEIYG